MLQHVEVGSALIAAHEQLRRAWTARGEVDVASRQVALGKLRRLLTSNAQEFAAALDQDFKGRSPHESLLTEIAVVVSAIDYTRPRIARWAKPRRVSLRWPHSFAAAKMIRGARGVAGIIGPSNYPLQLALMPLIGALSAGCRTLVKPSESAPRTARLLCDLVSDALDPSMVAIVPGDAETARQLSALPLDIVLFTGSASIGREVAVAAAANLTPTILELGGKSAVIIDRGANLGRAARSIMWGKLINAGQTCVAPDYVLVPAQDMDSVIDRMTVAARELYPDPASKDYTAIRSDTEFTRLRRLETRQKVVPLFERRLERPFFDPKLVIAPALDSAVMQEEIFGPLLPLIPYAHLDDALAVIDALPPALALYWFGARNERLRQVLRRTSSAAVSVNETVIHAGLSEIPLGGLGASGMGRYHGRAGFDAFTHERPVFQGSRFSVANLMRPPFGRRADAILKHLLR